jgi:exosortase
MLIGGLVLDGVAKWKLGGHADIQLSLRMFSLVLWWIGSTVTSFGAANLRTLLFPLMFLFAVVPPPDAAMNWAVASLQKQSANATRVVFQLARVPVTQDGVILSTPDLDIEVAEECSSIRSTLMPSVTALVLGNLFLRSWWRRAVCWWRVCQSQ